MTNLYNTLLAASLLLCVSAFGKKGVSAGSLNKQYDRAYAINPSNFYMELENKYGDIQIIPWDKDSVKIHVDVTVRSDKSDKLQETLDNISVEFQKTSSFLLVSSGWNEDAGFLRKTTFDFSQGINGGNKVQIDHIIHVPRNLSLELRNRFGNIFMEDHEGELRVQLSHGDFRARNLSNVERLVVKYGRLKVKRIKRGALDISSVKSATIGTAEEISLESASSDIEIENVSSIRLKSKHDDIELENVGIVKGSLTLSDIEIKSVTREVELNTKLGSLRLGGDTRLASSVRIESTKTELDVELDMNSAAKLNVNADPKCTFRWNPAIKYSSKGVDNEGTQYLYGSFGDDSRTNYHIRANGGFLELGRQ